MPVDVVIERGGELVRVKHLDSALLPSRTNRFALPQVNFYVHHAVREGLQLRIVVGSAVENKVSRLQVSFA